MYFCHQNSEIDFYQMNIKEFFGKLTSRYLLFHLLGMVAVVIILFLGVKFGLSSYTHHGESIELRDLTGMDFDKAEKMLTIQGLLIEVADSGHNKKMPSNCILNQIPAPGAFVKEGRTIYVTVNSTTLPSIKIPDIIDNSSYREAQARLTSLGFKMLEPKRVDGERDWVYGITLNGRPLQAGDLVPIESPLVLSIGNGSNEEEEEGDMMLDIPDMGVTESEVDDFEEVNAIE